MFKQFDFISNFSLLNQKNLDLFYKCLVSENAKDEAKYEDQVVGEKEMSELNACIRKTMEFGDDFDIKQAIKGNYNYCFDIKILIPLNISIFMIIIFDYTVKPRYNKTPYNKYTS